MQIVTAMGLLLLALSGLHTALAQTAEDPASEPRAAMARLDFMRGRWMQTVSFTEDAGRSWSSAEAIPIHAFWTLNELFLEERGLAEGDGGAGFVVEQIIGYDQYRDVYRMFAMDNVWGLPDVYEGSWDGESLVLDNLSSGTAFESARGESSSFRLSIQSLGADERVTVIDRSLDLGQSWQPFYRSVFLRMPD